MTADPIAASLRAAAVEYAAALRDLRAQRTAMIREYLHADRLARARIQAVDRMIAETEAAMRDAEQAARDRRAEERGRRAA